MKGLRFRKIPAILERELRFAEGAHPSYEEFFERLLREEYNEQQEQATENRIRRAHLPERLSLDTFPFDRQPEINETAIRQLAALDFVARGENLVFIGDVGVGKTGLGSALLLRAIQEGYRGLFFKAQDLFDEMYASLADLSTRKLLGKLLRVDLLLIDELGYLNLRPEQTNIFFKLMEERYTRRRSTILTTNLEYEQWYEFLKNKPLTKALLDRVRHRCHTIRIQGDSLREPTG